MRASKAALGLALVAAISIAVSGQTASKEMYYQPVIFFPLPPALEALYQQQQHGGVVSASDPAFSMSSQPDPVAPAANNTSGLAVATALPGSSGQAQPHHPAAGKRPPPATKSTQKQHPRPLPLPSQPSHHSTHAPNHKSPPQPAPAPKPAHHTHHEPDHRPTTQPAPAPKPAHHTHHEPDHRPTLQPAPAPKPAHHTHHEHERTPSPQPPVRAPQPPPEPAAKPQPQQPSGPPYPFSAYWETWRDVWVSKAEDHALACLPPYVQVVFLSFFDPRANYTGGLTFSNTGLDFVNSPELIRDAIAVLRTRNPNTKVLLSVGGATFGSSSRWRRYNVSSAAAFVKAFGLQGVDLDFEPSHPHCKAKHGEVYCSGFKMLPDIVNSSRLALPRPKLLTIALTGDGAFGEPGPFEDAIPFEGMYRGSALGLLRSSVAQDLDWLNIMSYDMGLEYSPLLALASYRAVYSGPIFMGVHVPPDAWGGARLSLARMIRISKAVRALGPGSGIMLWSLQASPDDGSPGPETISKWACVLLGWGPKQCNITISSA